MLTTILVIDSDTSFSAMLKQVLEDTGEYRVVLASTGREAVEAASSPDLDLAIVDMGLDLAGPDLIHSLRATHPRLAVMAIPVDDDPQSMALQDLDLQGFLTKPFFIPDLPAMIEEALGRPVGGETPPPRQRPTPEYRPPDRSASPRRPFLAPEPSPPPPPPPWLEDVNKAARYLAALSLETSAHAALLTRGPKIWAYAGQFSQAEAQELTRLVDKHWSRDDSRGAVARFVRLSPTGDDYMMYSIALAGDLVLSLVFQAETPIGMIRKQARQLVDTMTRTPPPPEAEPDPATEPEPQRELEPEPVPAPQTEAGAGLELDPPPAARLPGGWLPDHLIPPARPGEEAPPEPAAPPELEADYQADLEPELYPGIRPELPPPHNWVASYTAASRATHENSPEPAPQSEPATETFPEAQSEADLAARASPPGPAADIPDDWLPRRARPASHLPILDPLPERAPDALRPGLQEEQQPRTVAGPEDTRGSLYQLNYSFVIVPKFPRYRLAGDLVSRLEEWLRHFAVAYHWRVNRISIRPDHVLLSISCPPTTAPERMARQLKRLTSEKVFEEFPRLVQDDPSGDFWAPAYLLVGTGEAPGPQQIADYIARVRRRQGLPD